jgi:hypothetical protein
MIYLVIAFIITTILFYRLITKKEEEPKNEGLEAPVETKKVLLLKLGNPTLLPNERFELLEEIHDITSKDAWGDSKPYVWHNLGVELQEIIKEWADDTIVESFNLCSLPVLRDITPLLKTEHQYLIFDSLPEERQLDLLEQATFLGEILKIIPYRIDLVKQLNLNSQARILLQLSIETHYAQYIYDSSDEHLVKLSKEMSRYKGLNGDKLSGYILNLLKKPRSEWGSILGLNHPYNE